MTGTPRTWAEVTQRLAVVLGGAGGEPYATAEELIREACEATWGVELPALSRTYRQVALQRMVSTVIALEAQGELAFTIGLRAIVAETFARFWKGLMLDGPPWRLDPAEDRPLYECWAETHNSSFD